MLINAIIGAGILTVILMAFVVYHSAIHFAFKAAVFPLMIITALFGWRMYVDRLGAPIDGYPPATFTYIHHIAGQGGDNILVWAYTAKRGYRLYSLPYDRELMKDLNEAKEGLERDGDSSGRIVPSDDGFMFIRDDNLTLEGGESK